jgi:hypothetical protein
MDSKEIKYLTEAYGDMYLQEEDCQDLYNSVLNLCIIENYFDTLDECEEFTELLVVEDRVHEFMESILECYGIDDLETLNESIEYLEEKVNRAIRDVINALSKSGRVKAGLKPGTALGRKPESIVRGSAASTSIRSARASRPSTSTKQPNLYLQAQQGRRASRGLPAAGQTAASTPRAVTQRATTAGWERDRSARSAAQTAVDQAKTVAASFMKTMKQSAAQQRLSTAAAGTKATGVRVGQPAQATKALPPSPSQQARDASQWQKYQNMAQRSRDAEYVAPVPAWKKPPAAPKSPSTSKPDAGLTHTVRAVLSPAEKAGQQRYPGLARHDMSGQRRMPTGSETMATSRRRIATVLGATSAAAAAGLAASNSDKKQKNQKAEVEKQQKSQNAEPTKVTGGDVRTSFDSAFADARKRMGSTGSFEWTNPLTGKRGKYTTKYKEESVDTFDYVADMLLSEGYVNSYDDALTMMTVLDENALAKIAAGVIKNVIKSGASKLTKTKLPPKADPAFMFIKQKMIKQYGPEAVMGTPQQRYAAAAKKAELKRNPPPKPKPRDPFPDDVYSRSDFGIRGYRSGD